MLKRVDELPSRALAGASVLEGWALLLADQPARLSASPLDDAEQLPWYRSNSSTDHQWVLAAARATATSHAVWGASLTTWASWCLCSWRRWSKSSRRRRDLDVITPGVVVGRTGRFHRKLVKALLGAEVHLEEQAWGLGHVGAETGGRVAVQGIGGGVGARGVGVAAG